MTRRPRGTGTIERKRGRFMARLPTEDREPIGTFDTYEQAAARLDGWLAEQLDGRVKVSSGLALNGFGEDWLDRRELDGYRGIDTDRSRWKTHVLTSAFAEWPLKNLTRADVIDWVDELKSKRAAPAHGQTKRSTPKRKLSRTTIQNILNLLRCCLAAALERRLIPENPADGVRLRMKTTKTEEPWTYLTLEEQQKLFAAEAIPAPMRLLLQFAVGTGLRMGELWNLELRDLHVDGKTPHVFVRFGSKGKPPKNNRTRAVPLFGYALDAATRWLAQLPTFTKTNEHKLVFPTENGCRRQHGKPPGGKYKDEETNRTHQVFHDWIRVIGVTRPMRFHDLRHTCGSSLVSGLWGQRWPLDRVRDLLGHQSVKTTERYAHLAPSALQATAAAMPPVRHHKRAKGPKTPEPPSRLELETYGLRTSRAGEQASDVESARWRDGGIAQRLAAALAALGAGEPFALRALIEAAEEAAEALAVPQQLETTA